MELNLESVKPQKNNMKNKSKGDVKMDNSTKEIKILDACCGSRMFWFDKQNPLVDFMDIREYYEELDSGHVVDVKPDVVADFRAMPFSDETYDLIVFDPPHLIQAGDTSWLVKKYGKLDRNTWEADLEQGFDECMRVLKPNGILIFKWNETQIPISHILKAVGYSPLFGQKRQKTIKTHWLVFNKQNKTSLKNAS